MGYNSICMPRCHKGVCSLQAIIYEYFKITLIESRVVVLLDF